jgi:hypothetical protein
MPKRTKTIADLEADEKRWKTRMRRAFNALDKIDHQKRRLLAKAGAAPPKTTPIISSIAPQRQTTMIGIAAPETAPPPGFMELSGAGIERPATGDGFDIPGFLRRAKGTAADQAEAQQRKIDREAADKLREELAATKKAKATGRIATMKAKKAGDTTKMPLSGRAALDKIRNG